MSSDPSPRMIWGMGYSNHTTEFQIEWLRRYFGLNKLAKMRKFTKDVET